MTNLNEMFATATTSNVTTANARSLAGTAQLTSVAADLTVKTLNAINTLMASEEPADAEKITQMKDSLAASMKDHNAMDALLSEIGFVATADIEFLKKLDDATRDSMLKSQQSKRSRAKGKQMTQENYKALMTGAIAENLLRMAMNKEKQNGGRTAGSVGYTDAELEELANDQDKLRKVLRNVQSKKSIMKSKEGFSETDERWLELLETEEQLKAIRTDGNVGPRVDTTKLAVRNYLNEKVNDPSGDEYRKMTKSQLQDIIAGIAQMVGAWVEDNEQQEESTEA